MGREDNVPGLPPLRISEKSTVEAVWPTIWRTIALLRKMSRRLKAGPTCSVLSRLVRRSNSLYQNSLRYGLTLTFWSRNLRKLVSSSRSVGISTKV